MAGPIYKNFEYGLQYVWTLMIHEKEKKARYKQARGFRDPFIAWLLAWNAAINLRP